MSVKARFLGILLIVFFCLANTQAVELTDELSVSYNSYSDNNSNQTATTKIAVIKKLFRRFGVSVDLGVDAITSATPQNAETTAAVKASSSQRNYARIAGIYDDRANNVVLGGYNSSENDYWGRSYFVNYTRLINLENTALGVGGSQSFDTWRLGDLPRNDRRERELDFSLTQFLSAGAKVQLGYSNLESRGLLASPYRSLGEGDKTIREKLPSSRNGNAYAVFFAALLNRPTSVHLKYRYYADNWDIRSHTANLEVYREVFNRLVLGGRYRYYAQTKASFTKNPDQYDSGDSIVAIDQKYSELTSRTRGVILMYEPPGNNGTGLNDVKLKASYDLYRTSGNKFIEKIYGHKNIQADIYSLSFEYLY